MFRTVTVHPQELLCRYCMCRLWYVVRSALPDTSQLVQRFRKFFLKRCTRWDVSARTIVCTYSIYKEAPEDGPLRSETCTADTWVLINNQCNYIVYLVGICVCVCVCVCMCIYIYCKKWYTDLPMSNLSIMFYWPIEGNLTWLPADVFHQMSPIWDNKRWKDEKKNAHSFPYANYDFLWAEFRKIHNGSITFRDHLLLTNFIQTGRNTQKMPVKI